MRMANHVLALMAAASFVLSAPAAAYVLEGRVVSIADGDTLTLLDADNRQHHIRLAQIDAPEVQHGTSKPAQPFGDRSRQSLASLTYRLPARADCSDRRDDPHGREVCRVSVLGVDVNLEQVCRGMAWVYVRYAKAPEYFQCEAKARTARVGLWVDPKPMAPWEWRRLHIRR